MGVVLRVARFWVAHAKTASRLARLASNWRAYALPNCPCSGSDKLLALSISPIYLMVIQNMPLSGAAPNAV